jgi:hypothetical protein
MTAFTFRRAGQEYGMLSDDPNDVVAMYNFYL